tara:strand:- start:4395 stop:5333 length:939 start_codon:yes stop_codon:yes gene_type:complete
MARCLPAAGGRASQLGRLWTAALLANGLLLVSIPLVFSLAGPDPIEQPEFYENELLWAFTRSTSGRHFATHHLVSRWRYPGERIAAAIRDKEGLGTARLGVLDLSWDPSHGGDSGCRLGDASDRSGWRWSAPDDIVLPALPPLSPWPFSFAGFDGLEVVGRNPEGGESPGLPRFVAVRLWLIPNNPWLTERQRCIPRERLPEDFLRGATNIVTERLGEQLNVEVLPDPTGWLLATVIEWDREPSYLGTALLIDRGEGARQPAPVDEPMGGDEARHSGGSEPQSDGGQDPESPVEGNQSQSSGDKASSSSSSI